MSDKFSEIDLSQEELSPYEELLSNNTLFLNDYLYESNDSLNDLIKRLELTNPLLALDHLCLAEINFMDKELENLLSFIDLAKLKEIDLSKCNLTKTQLLFLNEMIPHMKELVYVDLFENSPSEYINKFDIISNFMENCPIQIMNLTSTNLLDENINQFSQSLASSYTLSELDLARNFLYYECCFGLSKVLSSSVCSLKALSLSNNNLTDNALKLLSVGIIRSKHLEELTLNLNKFENLIFLDSALLHNKKLSYLDLLANNISTRGKAKLLSCLSNSYGVKTIFLSNNPISAANFKYLIKQSKFNTNLALVDLIETDVKFESSEYNNKKTGLKIIIS